MRKHISGILLLTVALVLTSSSCADSRLVEPTDTAEEQEPEPHPLAALEHLHEDGNWYVGWAIPLSEELTTVTTVEEGKLIIPRDEFFDMELAILTPMDIVAGASEEHGFLKRVISIDRDENQWELTVVNAYLPEVFLEGNFQAVTGESDSSGGSGLSDPGHTVRQAADPLGEATFKKEEIEESCGRNCKSKTTISVGGGVSASINPKIEFSQNADGQERLTSRTLFEFSNLFPKNKEPGREMCSTISAAMSNFSRTNKRLIEAVRAKNASDREKYSQDLGESLVDLHKWAMHHAGHSPFPPYVPEGRESAARIQIKRINSSCRTDYLTWFRPEALFGDFDIFACSNEQTDNKYVVSPIGSGPDYALGTSNSGAVYHAMKPDFRMAVFDVTKQIARKRDLQDELESKFPDHLVNRYSSLIGKPAQSGDEDPVVPHQGRQWTDAGIRFKEFTGGARLAVPVLDPSNEVYGRAQDVFEREFRDDDELYDAWRELENRALVEKPFDWLSASLAVAKLYCAGVELSSARIGAGADLEFTWEPTFTLEFGVTGSTSQSNTRTVKKDLRVARQKTATLIGPVPFWYSIEGKVRFSAYLQLKGKLEWNVRKHKARADFFLGIEKNGDQYRKLTLADMVSPSTLDQASKRSEGNLFELFGVPNGVTETAHENSPIVSLGDFSIEGKVGAEPGFGFELVLYDFLGFGAGLNFTTEASLGYSTADGVSADATMGPTLEVFSSLKLPICEGDSCEEAARLVQSACNWPPANGFFCGNDSEFCKTKPYLCPQLTGGRSADIRIPIFNSCNWTPWAEPSEPDCRAPENSDAVPRPFPPCVKACYRSAPKTGNKWVALSFTGAIPRTHTWAGDPEELTGIAIDEIYLQGDEGEILNPVTVEVDSFTISNEDQRKLYSCDQDSCSRHFTQCSAEQLNRSVVHFRRSLLVDFGRELKAGDAIFLEQQKFPPSTDSETRPCGEEVGFEVLIGSKRGAGYWNSLGYKNSLETNFFFGLAPGDFATPESHEKKNAQIIPNMSVAR